MQQTQFPAHPFEYPFPNHLICLLLKTSIKLKSIENGRRKSFGMSHRFIGLSSPEGLFIFRLISFFSARKSVFESDIYTHWVRKPHQGKKGSQDTINNLPISDGRGAGCHTGSEEPTVLCDPFMSRWSLEGVMKYK